MNTLQAIQYISAQAITPDQLLSYVAAVSGAQSELVGDYVVHTQGDNAIVVGYPLQNPYDTEQLDACIQQVITKQKPQSITTLAPQRPHIAPANAISTAEDAYWFITLPPPPPAVKLRNMLARSGRDVHITKAHGSGAWTGAHQELMLDYIRSKGMDVALCSILQRLGTYLITSEQVELFSAYDNDSQELLACALGDFSSFSTAFYMFAFRKAQASPGVADAVLLALLDEALARGHNQCNLGLGINDGIRFFKKKWGANPTLPLVQTTWTVENKKKSWLARLLD